MKKIPVLLLTLMMALTLCACGGTSEPAAADDVWAYDDYMTEDEHAQLSAALEEYTASYNDLAALIEETRVELDDLSLAAIEGIPGDIESLNAILEAPSIMSGEMTAAELIEITQAQNELVLSFIAQINAAVGAN